MFGDRAHGTIRQQYLILKTGFFLAIELFLFPIVCGLLLDFSTMRLPSLSSILGSMEYTWLNPVSSIFVYWFIGMMFMVMFTWLITNCRDILRPGVMWFIRDPNDPQFHPIKEIIQRPIGSQLKKLGTSATMYALIIIIGVGGVAQAIHYFGHDFLPLQMNLS
jgi:E3 ubiquitin-protein ligase DOA10